MEIKTDALAVRPTQRAFSLLPASMGEAREMAELIARSDFAPKDYRGKPDNVLVAVQMGADLGLKPMQALQNIAVINGRPSIYGDAALALVMPALERFVESLDGDGMGMVATCIAKRKGWPDETKRTFSMKDAAAANLTGKAGPWTQYPKRMLQMRARGFCLRDVGADLLLGLVLAEEAMDYTEAIDAQVVHPETVAAPADPMERVPDGLRDNVEKAFTALTMSAAQRLAKLNEYFGKPDVTADDAAQQLLDWCRDEFAKRKTGQPRRKAENGNKKPQAPASTPIAETSSAAAESAETSGGPGTGAPVSTPPPPQVPPAGTEPFPALPPRQSEELF